MAPHTLLLAAPRGFCAGVDRAVLIVEKALEAYGAPVHVRHEIVHNTHVVESLRRRGAVFVEDETTVPEGSVIVFSAHGSPPEAFENSRRLGHVLIDATCPLVTKVHHEARRYARDGKRIVLVGHEGHQEVIGTMGQAPDAITLVETPRTSSGSRSTPTRRSPTSRRRRSRWTRPRRSSTACVAFPMLEQPKSDDICYATQNRQDAVKVLAERCDLILVVGSDTSSNSKRLVEVSRDRGVPSYLIEDASHIDASWLDGVGTVGLTSGASAPEELVEGVIAWFRGPRRAARRHRHGRRRGRRVRDAVGARPEAARAVRSDGRRVRVRRRRVRRRARRRGAVRRCAVLRWAVR
jgi:4-hydroxy-3-methylbut-2-en-1-yl diphosphate reductase